MGNCLNDALGRALQQIRNSDVNDSIAQTNRAVHVSECVKLHAKIRHWSSRTKFPIFFLKQLLDAFPQDAINLPRERGGTVRHDLWLMMKQVLRFRCY